MNDRNNYAGILEDWLIRLIHYRAFRMGFARHDIDDVTQLIAIETHAFTYCPERSNGATLKTVLTVLTDHQLKGAIRRVVRYKRRLDRYAEYQKSEPQESQSRHEMQFDVREAIAHLSPNEQRVCEMLMRDATITDIARELECGWRAAKAVVAGIRQKFARLGLNEWLGG